MTMRYAYECDRCTREEQTEMHPDNGVPENWLVLDARMSIRAATATDPKHDRFTNAHGVEVVCVESDPAQLTICPQCRPSFFQWLTTP